MPVNPRQYMRPFGQQQALLEFTSLKYACPDGLYLSLTPGNFTRWTGVLFVRTGPYAPAILRFHIVFASQYPNSPPLLTFTSDIFHPLVSPSTTYTHASGSLTSGPGIADRERLPPGGFSLRHGFPAWFEKEEGIGLETSKDVKIATTVKTEDGVASSKDKQSSLPSMKIIEESGTVGTVPARKEAEEKTQKPSPRTIFKILQYLKQAFEDEDLLDELPFDSAANSGAWRAWRAHRDNTAPTSDRNKMNVPPNTPQRTLGEGNKTKPSDDWSWSGIWEQRVGEGIESSISDPVLYGSTDNDDLIAFMDLDDEVIEIIKKNIMEKGRK